MKRFKAIGLDHKPYLHWAGTNEPLGALVVNEVDVPAYIYGVSPWYIVDGELVERTTLEMEAFEDEYNIQIGVKSEALRLESINKESFTYDSNDFPMDEVSRLFYTAIEKTSPANSKIRTMNNTAYNLADTDISSFMASYYEKLLLISKHTI